MGRRLLMCFFWLAAGILASGTGQAQDTSPLKSFWCQARTDYFSTATEMGQGAAVTAFGCTFTRLEGYVFSTDQPGTVALDLYWSEERQDNATVASETSKAELLAAGYRKTASEGFIYPTMQAGTVPLKLYFNKDMNEYYSTTPQTGEKAATGEGFEFVRTEGYIMPATEKGAVAGSAGYAAPSNNSDCCRKALDVQEIQNVMSRHAWYYSSGQHARELNELFALDMADVSWSNGSEWWVGKDLLWDYYVKYFDEFRLRDLKVFAEKHPGVEVIPDNLGSGTSMFHTNSTPVIEVAGDGKTAKGIWYSIGQVTQTPGGRQTPTYMWERYGVDFLKKDGKWKIWHFMVLTDWAAGPGQSWAMDDRQGGFGGPPGMQGPPPGGQAGESGGAPSANVRIQQKRKGPYEPPGEILFIPVPYETFSETESYGPPEKK